ncbi:MAG: OadG family protein [Vampirovibrionia bacterium]
MLIDGLIFMVLGMTTVFAFLTVLVMIMHLSYLLINFYGKYFPERVLEPQKITKNRIDPKIALAVAIAKAYSRKG